MKARGALAVLACAMTVLALPASAVAKPRYQVIEPSRLSLISLKGTNGYTIDVLGLNSRRVAVAAYRLGDFETQAFGSAIYSGPGKVTDERIVARFGSRGRVSVRFEPKGRPKVEGVSRRCEGKPSIIRTGAFTGTIRFRGEEGFTRVHAERASGLVHRSFRQVCKRPRGKIRPPVRRVPPTTSLSAVSSRYPRAPWFSVYKEEPRRPSGEEAAQYTVNTVERRGATSIFRSATAQAPPETFAVTLPGAVPVTATVAPPPPFSGTVTYERAPGGKGSWSGDLAVELPGRGTLPLTDPTYRAKLCRNFACACPIGECLFTSISVVESRAQRLRRLATRVRP